MDKIEFITTALELTKARLGISTTVRDALLRNAVESIIEELEDEKGLTLKYDSPLHLDFVKDYAVWRYQSAFETQTTSTSRPLSIPRHLQFRLHNLIIHQKGGSNDQDV
ncbi:phage head-tail connector protein [Sporosarcina highlanderae]|uniref:Phage head-tail connector protein n=1 Tax=Sporosarcina highlanderae TaxID=3035916 RepID=A0ABT8JVC0_9BACL|nr:phage head-tail connector protein [Sporosarcina highlanderae]MDN4609126.1 phage head-tail connector protein [Sporosarcina highlanderae]